MTKGLQKSYRLVGRLRIHPRDIKIGWRIFIFDASNTSTIRRETVSDQECNIVSVNHLSTINASFTISIN